VASSWFRRPQQLSVAIKKAERAVVTPAPAASAPRRAKSWIVFSYEFLEEGFMRGPTFQSNGCDVAAVFQAGFVSRVHVFEVAGAHIDAFYGFVGDHHNVLSVCDAAGQGQT